MIITLFFLFKILHSVSSFLLINLRVIIPPNIRVILIIFIIILFFRNWHFTNLILSNIKIWHLYYCVHFVSISVAISLKYLFHITWVVNCDGLLIILNGLVFIVLDFLVNNDLLLLLLWSLLLLFLLGLENVLTLWLLDGLAL